MDKDIRARAMRCKHVALAVTAAFLPSGQSYALPTGEAVVAGDVTVTRPTAQTMQINQATQKGIVNWLGFSIGASEHVNVTQPSASASLLNRVLGNNPSEIFGRLTANGRVFLVNPNGVLFAPGASVEVGSLFASSLALADQDFLAGRYLFSREGNAGSVVNQGTIVTANGYTALIGPQVRNDGVIIARTGAVALAAGDRVALDLIGDGLISVSVDQAALNASVVNTGRIEADGGTIVLTARSANALLDTVINTSGIVRANALVERNGEIILDGGGSGTVQVAGTVQADGSINMTGGSVDIAGVVSTETMNIGAVSGSISESAGGAILANTLTTFSAGATTLGGPNQISNFSGFSNGALSLTNSGALTVNSFFAMLGSGTLTNAGDVIVTGGWNSQAARIDTTGNLTVTGSVFSNGFMEVDVDGTLTVAASGQIPPPTPGLTSTPRMASLGSLGGQDIDAGGIRITASDGASATISNNGAPSTIDTPAQKIVVGGAGIEVRSTGAVLPPDPQSSAQISNFSSGNQEITVAGGGINVISTAGNASISNSGPFLPPPPPPLPGGGTPPPPPPVSQAPGSQTITVTAGPGIDLFANGGSATITQNAQGGAQSITATNADHIALDGRAGLASISNFQGEQTISITGTGNNALSVGSAGGQGLSQVLGRTQVISAGDATRGEAGRIELFGANAPAAFVGIVTSNAPGAGNSQTVSTAGTITIQGGHSAFQNPAPPPANITNSFTGITHNSNGQQTINAASVGLQGGAGLNNGVGISSNQGARQQVAARTITLEGGRSGTNNTAFISSNSGGDQTVIATGGSITITGGDGGSGNRAGFNTNANQTITGNPNLVLTGGAGGGAGSASNNVSISATGDETKLQTINARTIEIRAGAGTDASATLNAARQVITTTGNVSLFGGAGLGSTNGVRIGGVGGNTLGPTNLTLTVGGDLLLHAGTANGAGLGSSGASTQANTIVVTAGNITLESEGAGARIGTSGQVAVTPGNISVTAAGNLQLGDGTAIRANGPITLTADSLTNSGTITNGGGSDNMLLSANHYDLAGGTVQGGSAAVLLRPRDGSRSFGIEAAGDPTLTNHTNITNADIASISTSNFIVFGSGMGTNFTGDMTIGQDAQVNGGAKNLAFFRSTSPGGTTTIGSQGVTTIGDVIVSAGGGAIVSNGGTVAGDEVQLRATQGIGEFGTRVHTVANALTVGTSGDAFVAEANDVTLRTIVLDVGGNTALNTTNTSTGGMLDLTAGGALNVAGPVTSNGSMNINAAGALNVTGAGAQDAILSSNAGQTITAQSVSVTAHDGRLGQIVNNVSGEQTITTGALSVGGGSALTYPTLSGVVQNAGAAQTINASSIQVQGTDVGTNNGIFVRAALGDQRLNVTGDITIAAGAGGEAWIQGSRDGLQKIYAHNITMKNAGADDLTSPAGTNSFAALQGGHQEIHASGDVLLKGGRTAGTGGGARMGGLRNPLDVTASDLKLYITGNLTLQGGTGADNGVSIGTSGSVALPNAIYIDAGSVALHAGSGNGAGARIGSGSNAVAGGNIEVHAGAIELNGAAQSAVFRTQGNVWLDAASINQVGNGFVAADRLTVTTTGAANLAGPNLINQFDGTSGGPLTLRDAGSLQVLGITTTNAPITLTTDSLINSGVIANGGDPSALVILNANAFNLAGGEIQAGAAAVAVRPRNPVNLFGIESAGQTTLTNADIAKIFTDNFIILGSGQGSFTGSMTIGQNSRVEGGDKNLAFLGSGPGTITIGTRGVRTGGDVIVSAGPGAIASNGGTVAGDEVQLRATQGIGASSARVNTDANALTVGTSGNAFVTEANDVTLRTIVLNVGGNTALNTTNTSTGGALDLIVGHDLNVAGTVTSNGLMTIAAGGALDVTASGAQNATLTSNGGQTISAQSLLVSAAGGQALISNNVSGNQTITISGGGSGAGIDVRTSGSTPGLAQIENNAVGGTQTLTLVDGDHLALNGAGAFNPLAPSGAGIIASGSQVISLTGSGANALRVGSSGVLGTSQIRASGNQTITAGSDGELGSITLTGPATNNAFTGIVTNTGIGANTQTISTTGAIDVTAGFAPSQGSNFGTGIFHNRQGLQTVNAGSITLRGGTGGSNNVAFISTNPASSPTAPGGRDQVINVTGDIAVLGSDAGSNNRAVIVANNGNQTINARDITLRGGDGGTNNHAQITASAAGTQTIHAHDISLSNGTGGADVVATITGGHQTIDATGTVTLSAQGSIASGVPGSTGVRIGGPGGNPTDLKLFVDGDLILNGGSAANNGVGIGSSSAGVAQPNAIEIEVGGSIILTGGSLHGTNARIGSSAQNGLADGTLTISAGLIVPGGSIELNGGSVQLGVENSASIRTQGSVTLHAASISENANGLIIADTLTTTTTGGATALSGPNEIKRYSATSAGDLNLNNTVALEILGLNALNATVTNAGLMTVSGFWHSNASTTMTTTGPGSDLVVNGFVTSSGAMSVIVDGTLTVAAIGQQPPASPELPPIPQMASLTSSAGQNITAKSVLVSAQDGASATIGNHAGDQTITVSSGGIDVRASGNVSSAAEIGNFSTGNQTITVLGAGDVNVSSTGGFAAITNIGSVQFIDVTGGALSVAASGTQIVPPPPGFPPAPMSNLASVSSSAGQNITAHSVLVAGQDGGLATIGNNGGEQTITVSGGGIDVLSSGGVPFVQTNANISNFSTGSQTITTVGAGGLNLSSTGGFASIASFGSGQVIDVTDGVLTVAASGLQVGPPPPGFPPGPLGNNASLNSFGGQNINAKSVLVSAQDGGLALINNQVAGNQTLTVAGGSIDLRSSGGMPSGIGSSTAQIANFSAGSQTITVAGAGGLNLSSAGGFASVITGTFGPGGGGGEQTITVSGGTGLDLHANGGFANIGQGVPGASQTITVKDAEHVKLNGVSGTALINSAGEQTLSITGSGANAITLGSVGANGSSQIIGASNQKVTAGEGTEQGSIAIIGSSQNGAGASILSQAVPTGTQTVSTTGLLKITGGGAGAQSNPAGIFHNGSGLQKISAAGLELRGGTTGNGNGAIVGSNGGGDLAKAGDQRLDITGDILMVAGNGGDALINGGLPGQRQTIYARNIEMSNGDGGNNSFAGIRGGIQEFHATGDVRLTAHSTGGVEGGVRIGSRTPNGADIELYVGGNLVLTGGSGVDNNATIGSSGASGAVSNTIYVETGGSVILNSGTGGGARFGTSTAVGTGSVEVHAARDIQLNGVDQRTAIRAGTVTLDAANISEASNGLIVAGTLNTTTRGNTVLTGPNQVSTFNGTASAGNLTLNNSGALTVTGLNASNAAALTNAGDVSVIGPWNSLTASITTTGAGSDLAVNSAVTSSGTMNVNVSGALNVNNAVLSSTGGQTITAQSVNVTAQGGGFAQILNRNFGQQAINAGTVDVQTLAGGGTAEIRNNSAGAQTLTVTGDHLNVHGLGGGSALVIAAGGNQTIDMTGVAGKRITLGSEQALGGSSLRAGGNQLITGNADILMTGGSGPVQDGSNALIIAFNPSATQTIDARTLTLANSSIGGNNSVAAINGANQTITTTGDVRMTANASGGSLPGVRIGGLGGGGGLATATNLTLNVGGDLILTGGTLANNGVGIGSTATPDAPALANNITINAPNGDVVLNSGVAGSGVRIGAAQTDGGIQSGGNIAITAGGEIRLNGVDEFASIRTRESVTLQAASITETAQGRIIAGSLSSTTSGNTLLSGPNQLAAFNATSSGGDVTLNNSGALAVTGMSAFGDATITNLGTVTVSGPWTAGGTSTITVGSDILLRSAMQSQDVVLVSTTGGIDQDPGASITAETLTTRSLTDTVLAGPNQVSSFSAVSESGDVSLTNTSGLLTLGSMDLPGRLSITQTGDVAIGAANAQNATLVYAAGDISIDASGAIAVRGSDTTAGAASAVVSDGALEFNAGNVSLIGGGALAAPVLARGDSVTMAIGGELTVTGGSGHLSPAVLSSGTDIHLTVGSAVRVNGGPGALSLARIQTETRDGVIHIAFPNLAEGGYFVNGVEGRTHHGQTGFFTLNRPGKEGRSLLLTYGD